MANIINVNGVISANGEAIENNGENNEMWNVMK